MGRKSFSERAARCQPWLWSSAPAQDVLITLKLTSGSGTRLGCERLRETRSRAGNEAYQACMLCAVYVRGSIFLTRASAVHVVSATRVHQSEVMRNSSSQTSEG